MIRIKVLFFIAVLSVYSFIVMAGIEKTDIDLVKVNCGQYYNQVQAYLELNQYVDIEYNQSSQSDAMCHWIEDACMTLSDDPDLFQDMVSKGYCKDLQG